MHSLSYGSSEVVDNLIIENFQMNFRNDSISGGKYRNDDKRNHSNDVRTLASGNYW